MNARRTALAVLVAALFVAPAAAHAAGSVGSGCTPGAALLSHGFVVGASSDVRNVRAGNEWISTVMVDREFGVERVPAAGVAVEVTLRFAGGHLASTTGTTDHLGRLVLKLRVPSTASAGYAAALWDATERIDAPCGPAFDSYGHTELARAIRVTR